MVFVHVFVEQPESPNSVAPFIREKGILNPMRLSKLGEYGHRIVADGKERDPTALEVG